MDQLSRPESLITRLESLPFSRWHWHLAIIACAAVLFDAADFAMFGAALPPIAREFHLDPAQAGLLATIGLMGASVGAIGCGTISDYIGRKTSFILTITLFSIFTALTAISWNIWSLGAFRFFANVGLGGLVPVSLTLVSEFMPTDVRGRAASWVQASFPIGLAIAAGMSILVIGSLGWRILFVVGLVPLLLVYFAYRYLGESVRYLISRGKLREAERVLESIEATIPGRIGVKESSAVPAIQADIGEPDKRITVMELLAPEYIRRTVLLWIVSFCFFWSANGLLFMLPTILTHRGLPLKQALSFALVQGLFGFFGYIACGYLVDKVGRRYVLFFYFLVGSAFHLWFAEASGLWMYVAIAGVGWVNPGVFGTTSVYVGELYPTHIRATAIGWFYGIGRIGSFIAPAIIGLLLFHGKGELSLPSFALTYFIAAVAIFLVGIETRGLVLEQITTVRVGTI